MNTVNDLADSPIDAHPTKTFFVEMLVRDIALEQAILDLVDNSVDGAKRFADDSMSKDAYAGRSIEINFDREAFSIVDNCGGFDRNTARDYAFRFGRMAGATNIPHSIGQFGVGMKRALFKFGRHFRVASATGAEAWAVDVNVTSWETTNDWYFPWTEVAERDGISNHRPGTSIHVTNLRPEVATRFSEASFAKQILILIASKHRHFISKGLSITVNGSHANATELNVLRGKNLGPGIESFAFAEDDIKVDVKIVVGVGDSSPKLAGWYVICNGRAILEADRRKVTGWGVAEINNIAIPSFHNQFARFRGIVYFDSQDSSRVPWNTTKTDVDQDSPVWRAAFERMTQLMRPVIDFLNELDADIDIHGADKSPMMRVVKAASLESVDVQVEEVSFVAPVRDTNLQIDKLVRIQYSKPRSQIEYLQEALSLKTATAVGEYCFDTAYAEQGGT
jgi:hypothetical protein